MGNCLKIAAGAQSTPGASRGDYGLGLKVGLKKRRADKLLLPAKSNPCKGILKNRTRYRYTRTHSSARRVRRKNELRVLPF